MRLFLSVCATSLLGFALHAAQQPNPSSPFVPHPVATNIYGGKQLAAADINKDGKQDLVALGSQMTQLVWFENPYWERRSIMHGAVGMSSFAAADIDNDGIPEIALAFGRNIGLLYHLGDPRGIWLVKGVNSIEPARRLMWVDVDGTGQQALVDAPILDRTALFERSGSLTTPILYYRPDRLAQERLTLETREQVRNLLVSDSGDVVAGSLNKQRFFSMAIGNSLVFYREGSDGWQSTIVDGNLPNGRALLAVDINGDGNHEIVASTPETPKKILLYRVADSGGQNWQRMVLDDSMAAIHCIAAELTGDRKIDISCIDDATPFSVHWYENRGQ